MLDFYSKLSSFKPVPTAGLPGDIVAHAAVERERRDVGGDAPADLLRLQGQDDLIVRVRDELEGGEAVRRVQRAGAPHGDGAEVGGAGQEEVGGAALVRRLLVALVTGAAREEEPALEALAPRRRLVDEVAWGTGDIGDARSGNVSQSSYLHTVGEKLLPGIDVLWTGESATDPGPHRTGTEGATSPKVVSHKISVESIDEVSSVLKRAPVIWDNIHANDYDPQRIYLGPFKDRPTELIGKLGGVLTNPNCEFHPNFVAVHTLATKKNAISLMKVSNDEEQDPCYSPQEALTLALTDWLQEFQSSDQPGGRESLNAAVVPRPV
ncbi:Protein O-GlcNAcase [Liparis tanakae]|uniref:Protein O-GlcNAcase n=1 Tax=Liparis tanakae TaxID=230148 RepID=A0A4Z2EP58_9TELE|nr:Protein O-GlcNAcase [Liparis tanakae]